MRWLLVLLVFLPEICGGCDGKTTSTNAGEDKDLGHVDVTSTPGHATPAEPALDQTEVPAPPARTPAPVPRTYAPSPRSQAIERAISFLRYSPPSAAHAPLFLDCIHRRFGVAAFRGMPARYDRLRRKASGIDVRELRVYRKILDASNELREGDLEAMSRTRIDRITAPALYCDRFGFPPDYAANMKEVAKESAYGLTHVALALIWIGENGCTAPLSEEFRDSVIERLAALTNRKGGLTDVKIEAATFLHCLGRGDRVRPEFIDLVVASQLPAGGWSADSRRDPRRANWHATCLALWLLLEVDRNDKGPILPHG